MAIQFSSDSIKDIMAFNALKDMVACNNPKQITDNNMEKRGDFREGETREDFDMSKIAKDDSLELKNISMQIVTGNESKRHPTFKIVNIGSLETGVNRGGDSYKV